MYGWWAGKLKMYHSTVLELQSCVVHWKVHYNALHWNIHSSRVVSLRSPWTVADDGDDNPQLRNSATWAFVVSKVLAMPIALSRLARPFPFSKDFPWTESCWVPTISCSMSLVFISTMSANLHLAAATRQRAMNSSTSSSDCCFNWLGLKLARYALTFGSMTFSLSLLAEYCPSMIRLQYWRKERKALGRSGASQFSDGVANPDDILLRLWFVLVTKVPKK